MVPTAHGALAHARDVVRHEVELYKRWWSSSRPVPAWIPDRTALPKVNPGELRAVARSFSHNTTAAPDHFHPRHFLLLEDQALEVVALMFKAMESLGLPPRQLCWLTTPMLPKTSGSGNRLVVLYAGLYRIWQRMRRPVLRELQEKTDRPYWGAARGRSSVDCAWLQAAEGEADSKQAYHGALAVADFSKFYERIPLTNLRDKYISFIAPTAFLKLVHNMWRAPRVLGLAGHHAEQALCAECGLPAGDVFCDVSVKV